MSGSRSTLSLPPFSPRRRTISFLLLQLLVAAKQATALAATALALGMSSVTDLDCSLLSSPMDPFFDPITSCDRRRGVGGKLSGASSPPPAKQQLQQQCGADDSRHARREDATAAEGPAAALRAHASTAAAIVCVVIHVC
ncbi:hypothetical protein ACQJBY_069217 [Aegilops geniculata]